MAMLPAVLTTIWSTSSIAEAVGAQLPADGTGFV